MRELKRKTMTPVEWERCYPNCKDWWIMTVDGEIVTTCKEQWGAGSCRDSPANKKMQKGQGEANDNDLL